MRSDSGSRPSGLRRAAAQRGARQSGPKGIALYSITTPYGRDCRLRDAKQAVRDKYHAEHMRRLSDMQAEIDDLERQFRSGEFQ